MFDINKMLKELSNMKDVSTEKVINEDLKNTFFIGESGDDDMGVKVQINGYREIKSISFTNGLKDFILESPEDFWQLLPDLIIAAFSNATSKIANDEEESGDSSDIVGQINKMTESFGGMDQILKSLGSGNPNDLMKNMASLMGGGPKRKK